jgi:hypothetical protein
VAVNKNQQPKTLIEQMHMKKLLTTISIGGLLAVSSVAIAQQASDIAQQTPESPDSSNRLEARLQPVIAVDASGQARLDNEVGTGNDRFTSEVEIAKADFADLGITLEMASAMKSSSCASFAAAWSFSAIVSSFPEIL